MVTSEMLMNMPKEELVKIILELKRDHLTGAYKREVLSEINKSEYTVALIDINGLKRINDIYGHDMGDQLILLVANNMKKLVSNNDIIVRYGGDEFVIVFEDDNVFNINEVLKKIPNVSYGIGRSSDIHSAISIADRSMYKNKRDYYISLLK